MDDMQITPTTYIKSNIATVKGFMTFLSILLLAIVIGISAYVIISYKDTRDNRFEKSNEFHFELKEGAVTVLEFVDQKATKCEIPASIKYGSRSYPITTISANAFTNNSVLTEVVIPDSVIKILGDKENERGAFSGCTALKTVQIGSGVTHIGAYAFKNCVALTSVNIPANVQFVEENAFQNCLELKTIELNSNGSLAKNSFENCLYVDTLKLGDAVRLNDNARESLSGLTRLNNFVVSDNNQHCRYDEANHCLLAKTNKDDDTLVMAGCDAVVPASVTQILDWSFGVRTPENLYVPSTVTKIDEKAFNDNPICTDAVSKPWSTISNKVNTSAVKCKFTANDAEPVYKYVYTENGNRVMPVYDDIFPNVKNPTPFKEWETTDNVNYNAVLQSEDKGGYVNADGSIKNRTLKDAIDDAEFLLGNKNNDAKIYSKTTQFYRIIKVEYWHEFKSLYSKIKNLDLINTYDYIVADLTQKLSKIVDLLNVIYNNSTKDPDTLNFPNFSDYSNFSDYEEYVESESWEVGLLDLVKDIENIEEKDLPASSLSVFNSAKSLASQVSDAYNNKYYGFMDSAWLDLREKCESLTFNIESNSQLQYEINEYYKVAQDKNLYTNRSWKNLEKSYDNIYLIDKHSLNISTARKALAAARANLREIGLEEDIIRLKTWISISEDLDVADYYTEGYDELILNIACINPDAMIKRSDVSSAIGAVVNLYNNLELIEFVPEAEPTILNINTLPYFVIAAVLFTGAVVSGSYAMSLKSQMRRGTQE